MSLDAVENARSRFLDVIHRLRKHFNVTVVKLDVIGTVVDRIQPECSTDDMSHSFRLCLADRLCRFLATVCIGVELFVCGLVDQCQQPCCWFEVWSNHDSSFLRNPIGATSDVLVEQFDMAEYRYYRCARYTKGNHPRIRIREEQLDEQVLALFDKLRVVDENVRDWFSRALRARTRDQQEGEKQKVAELNRQLTFLRNQRDQLLNLRLLEEIEQSTFAEKNTELRDRIAAVTLQVEACDRSSAERADIAVKAFELSQTLKQKWVNADHRAKRQILEILCLNFFLDGATLVPVWRKPFDMLAEGLISENSRGDWI